MTELKKMQKQLIHIAEIRTGHTFRGKVPDDPHGDLHVLQIKDLRGRMTVTAAALQRINSQGIRIGQMLEVNDVVMPARGDYYNAAIIKKDNESNKPIIASNQVFIIRVNPEYVLADYLCWYLNQKAVKNYISNEIRGTNIPMISKDSLSRLKVIVPPFTTQTKIIELVKLWQKEKYITEQLMKNRERMLQGTFQRLLEQ